MAFTFIHTADWQLGKSFGQFPADIGGALRLARQSVISKIAEAARAAGAKHVLVAGDVWDSAIPSNATLRQPLTIMGEAADIKWWLLPGNHDPDGPDGLWDRIDAVKPINVNSLRVAEPREIETGVFILPAPWSRIQHGQDLTDWMSTCKTPDGALRIGLAHGGVRGFGAEGEGAREIIPPDRAVTARLDYLALGDCPKIEIVPTASYDWPLMDFVLEPGTVETRLNDLRSTLHRGHPLRQTHVRLNISGDMTVEDWAIFERFKEEMTGECASFDVRGANLVRLVVVPEDIESLDAQGSVREAAESLAAKSEDPDLSREDRQIASEALRLLFRYASETT